MALGPTRLMRDTKFIAARTLDPARMFQALLRMFVFKFYCISYLLKRSHMKITYEIHVGTYI